MKLLTKFARHLCAVYTVTSLLFLLLHWALAGSFENTVIRPEAFLLLLPFAGGIALANVLFALHQMPQAMRYALHFVICSLSAFLFLYLPAGTGASAGMKFLMYLLMALIYWIVMGLYLALTAKSRRKRTEQTEYQSVFKK